ncbi:flavin reductase family protein [Chamaesiphon sp. VAR_69_metabat_338]|uniref:flavin reductase family protein n=1 Tax=Chamaesiphon sp. VAR_69_metabat_338 TaxID=2964704 RepID=UPI00286D9F57|nr:flavin reductase family protein [Chamaesiphon sp. VAR_69_metabat_338]
MSQHTNDPQSYLGFDCADLSPSEAYRLLNHVVSPRPIAFVSTLSRDGIPNLAPFSYFMAGGLNPPSIAFSPTTNRHEQPKDTLRNICDTGEFVINVVSAGMQDGVNIASLDFEPSVSEWERAGFTPASTTKVRPARVAESLMAIECRLFQIVSHGSGANAANYVIGEVVYFHIAPQLMVNGEIDPAQVQYLSRMGGNWYDRASADSMFELARPRLES